MEDFKKILKLFAFPLLILVPFFLVNLSENLSTGTFASFKIYFGQNSVNITENWLINSINNQVYRRFPNNDVFSKMKITSARCKGDVFIAFDSQYTVVCENIDTDLTPLSITYTLTSPYVCYDDACIFDEKFLENTPLEYLELSTTNKETYTFPDLKNNNVEGISSFRLISKLPVYFSGERKEGNYAAQLNEFKRQFIYFTYFEQNVRVNLAIIISFEIFFAFLVYLYSKFEHLIKKTDIKVRKMRTPYELKHLFFEEIDEHYVLGSTFFDLARRGIIEITGRHIKIKKTKTKSLFETEFLSFLNLIAEKKSIFLDKIWINDRIAVVGKEKLQKILKKLNAHSFEEVNTSKLFSDRPKGILMLVQFSILMLSIIMFFVTPAYLLNYKSSLSVLILINSIWLFLTRNSKAFLKLNKKGEKEKSEWLSLKKLLRSRQQLEVQKNMDWTYLLVFATFQNIERTIIKVIERKKIKLKNIKNPLVSLGLFEFMLRSIQS